MGKKKVLFIAEAVTLAHVARPLMLSAALDPHCFDIAFACDPRSRWVLAKFPGRYFPLRSIPSDAFLTALAKGAPLYTQETLDCYVRDDLQLLKETKPDAVVGDFRLSLSISARIAGIRYLTISNCYWSPYWTPRSYPVPNLPMTRILPLPIANAVFQLVRPVAFALHTKPLNGVRRSYGLPTLGSDLRRIYTDADEVVYADLPELFPGADLPAHHRFIGPVLWSPSVPAPDWWSSMGSDRPIIYLTLGSSGQNKLLPDILQSLASLDVRVIAATAGKKLPNNIPSNSCIAEYLPGEEAARRADLVICNGGSPTSQQALAAGTPVIGVASNLDQFLNMATIRDAGAGELMRADRFDGHALAKLARSMLRATEYKSAARRLADSMAGYDSGTRFATILERILGSAATVATPVAGKSNYTY